MCPLAFCSLTAPCTDLRDNWPLPPRTLTSPFTVSAVTPACAPSTSMSVETPCKFISIQVGALIWYSTICARPRRLSAFTLTVELPTPTSMRSRLEWVACTRTAFWFRPGMRLDVDNFGGEIEPHAGPDGHGRIGLLGRNQRDHGRDVQE